MDVLFNQFLSHETILELKTGVEAEFKQRHEGNHHLLSQRVKELRETESEINKLVEALSLVEYKRSLLERLDHLEKNRLDMEHEIDHEKQTSPESLIDLSDKAITVFLKNHQNELSCGEPERKKAVIRSLVESGEFNGNQLLLHPNVQQ